MAPSSIFVALALVCCCPAATAFESESIFAIAAPNRDEDRALEIKHEQFWEPVLHAAKGQEEVKGHAALYTDAEAALAGLSQEHEYVRQAVRDALSHLRHADGAVLAQATQQAQLASEQLSLGEGGNGGLSPSYGGHGILAWALQGLKDQLRRRFAVLGGYTSRLHSDIAERREGVLPALEGAAAKTTDVLDDLHAASSRSFDALKYDIYNQGVAKTPEAVSKIAKRIIDAVAETRGRFLKLSTASAEVVTRDTEGEQANPSAFVSQALRVDMEPFQQKAEDEHLISL